MQKLLDEYESTRLVSGISLAELIRRPELSYDKLAPIDKDRPELSEEVREEVNINLKYEGYIKRQQKQVEQFHSMRVRRFLQDIDYEDIKSLRLEAIQKVIRYSPEISWTGSENQWCFSIRYFRAYGILRTVSSKEGGLNERFF